MNITIICVGKLKEKFWTQACDEYLKRMSAYANVRVCEVSDVDPARAGGVQQSLEREGCDILNYLQKCSASKSNKTSKAGKVNKVANTNKSNNSGSVSSINRASAHVFLLAIDGKQLSSVEFSQHLDDLKISGVSDFVFIIGGSDGVCNAVKGSANELLSFGKITLPHNLARVVLLEQLYRAFKISRGEPYHK